MELRFQCPHCPAGISVDPLESGEPTLTCPNCQAAVTLSIGPDIVGGGPIERCCVCGSGALFLRKDFPQRLGLGLVAGAAIASFVALYFGHVLLAWAIPAAAVLADIGLFYVRPRLTGCYACKAEYRRAAPNPNHRDYDLAVADKHGR